MWIWGVTLVKPRLPGVRGSPVWNPWPSAHDKNDWTLALTFLPHRDCYWNWEGGILALPCRQAREVAVWTFWLFKYQLDFHFSALTRHNRDNTLKEHKSGDNYSRSRTYTKCGHDMFYRAACYECKRRKFSTAFWVINGLWNCLKYFSFMKLSRMS